VFSILAIFFKPLLRRQLLKYGFKRLANCVVPDMEGDVAQLTVKIAELQAFLAKDVKKLPRLMDVTPELEAVSIELDVLTPLGKGGFGVVYRGVLNSQPVAVKALFSAAGPNDAVIPADVKKQMRQEATIMCSLNHPNVLHVFGVVPSRGWIVMELCVGGALSELLLDAEQVLDEPTLVRLAAETATGVAYLHTDEIKIVHGDLKAANVLLTAERSVRICDFGMAEAKDRSKSMTSIGMGSAASAGITVAWTAPEVLQNEDKSFASDVFALGITLWEIFERAKPFGRMPDMAAVNQLLNGLRPALTDKTPARAAKVIGASWAQEPKKRCTAAEAACVLTALRRSGSGEV
jgi:serine/threonine protein kinase